MALRAFRFFRTVHQHFKRMVTVLTDVFKDGHTSGSSFRLRSEIILNSISPLRNMSSDQVEEISPREREASGFAQEFVPRWWLRSPDLQTIASQFLPRGIVLPAPEERLFQVEEGVQVRCVCHWLQEAPRRITVLIVHGLEGSSESAYMLGCTQKALAKGMNVVRMNVRNCGGTEAFSPT